MKCTDNGVANNFIITGLAGLNTTGSSGSSCITDYVEFLGSPGGKYCGADFGVVESKRVVFKKSRLFPVKVFLNHC